MKNHLSGLFRCPRLFVLFFGFTSFLATAQVGINTTSPEAMLDVVSSNSGLLIPRVALTSTTVAAPVVGPTESEMVFNTSTAGDVTPGFYYYWDGKWVRFSGEGGAVDPGNSWQLEGNAGTVPGTGNGENFLGTTDAKDLHIATNKNTRLIVKSDAHQVQAAGKGTAGRPFYSFKDGDGKAGMYLMGNNNNLLSFSTDGIERFRIGHSDPDGLRVQHNIRSKLVHLFTNGDESEPSIAFTFPEVLRNGFYSVDNDNIGVSAKGRGRLQVGKDGVVVTSSLSITEGPVQTLGNGVNELNLRAEEGGNHSSAYSHYRIQGPTAAFSIGGLRPLLAASAQDGQTVTLINTTGHPLTLIHNNASTSSERRIYCPTESNFALHGKYSTVTLMYNKTLQKWFVTDYADGGATPMGQSIYSVKGTTDALHNSHVFADVPQMSVTFTPKNSVVYVSFSASGAMDVGSYNIITNGGAVAFRLINVTAGNSVQTGLAALATDFDSDLIGNETVISAWNVSLNMFPVQVTPGQPTTLKMQWMRAAYANPAPLVNYPATEPDMDHRVLTVFDMN